MRRCWCSQFPAAAKARRPDRQEGPRRLCADRARSAGLRFPSGGQRASGCEDFTLGDCLAQVLLRLWEVNGASRLRGLGVGGFPERPGGTGAEPHSLHSGKGTPTPPRHPGVSRPRCEGCAKTSSRKPFTWRKVPPQPVWKSRLSKKWRTVQWGERPRRAGGH